MNETYLLRDLLYFWQRQAKDGYKVIEAIVNLLEYESDNLPQSKKEQVILDTLRLFGLFEIGYKGERKYFEKVNPIPEIKSKPEEDIVWEPQEYEAKLEVYRVQLLNALIEFTSFMN